jgi:hypothetical protein
MDLPGLSSQSYDVKQELSDIKASLQQVVCMLSESHTANAALAARISMLELSASGSRSEERQKWSCPVCLKAFAHRASFKGHIRRLAISDPTSGRNHCFLDPERPEHIALLAHPRYGNGDFKSRACAFSHQMYDTVKSNSTSTRTSESSHSAVSDILVLACDCLCIMLILPKIQSWLEQGALSMADNADAPW